MINETDTCPVCGKHSIYSIPRSSTLECTCSVETYWEKIRELQQKLADATEWRPMETAPKDGSVFMIKFNSKTIPVFVSWSQKEFEDDKCFQSLGTWCTSQSPICFTNVVGWLPLPEYRHDD